MTDRYNRVCDLISSDPTWCDEVRQYAEARQLDAYFSDVVIYNLTNAIDDIENPNAENHEIAIKYYHAAVS